MPIELLQNVLYPMADIGERPGEASSPTPSPPFQGRKKVSLRPGIPLSQGLDDRSPAYLTVTGRDNWSGGNRY